MCFDSFEPLIVCFGSPLAGLGAAVRALQAMAIVLTSAGLGYALAEIFANSLSRYNVFTGISTTLGGKA